MLPANIFFRIHHSHVINLGFVKKYHKGRGGVVEMNDGTMIEVATEERMNSLRYLVPNKSLCPPSIVSFTIDLHTYLPIITLIARPAHFINAAPASLSLSSFI
jgi:hypothetical protein